MSDRGRFIWHELLTDAPERAIEFYCGLLGWGHTVWEGQMPYHMLTVQGVPRYGVLQRPEEARAHGAPPHWLGYVYVPDRDVAVQEATELGARQMVAMDIPEVGSFAVLADPQGALLAVFQPASEPEPERDPGLGEVGWNELATSDHEAAFDFYSSMFGWEILDDIDMGEDGPYRIFGRDGRQLGGMWNKPPEMPAAWIFYHQVESCADAAERIPALGGSIVNGPMQVPGGGTIVQAIDPTGATFALFQSPTVGDED